MNCFCGMLDKWMFSLISSRNHCQKSSPSQISDTLWTGFEHAQSLIPGLVEWSYAVAITTTPRRSKKCILGWSKLLQTARVKAFTLSELLRENQFRIKRISRKFASVVGYSALLSKEVVKDTSSLFADSFF